WRGCGSARRGALVRLRGAARLLPAPPFRAPGPAETGEAPAEEVGWAPLAELLLRYRRGLLEQALADAGGSQQEAARLLGLHRQSFARMLRAPEGGGID